MGYLLQIEAMCWCLRVYWTVLQNLFIRVFSNIGHKLFMNPANNCCDYCSSSYYCCCCCRHYCCECPSTTNRQAKLYLSNHRERQNMPQQLHGDTFNIMEMGKTVIEHEYVIMDDIDANYLEVERRKIETEDYYRTVDRNKAEDILIGREDGTCLVRPYKETDISIKYIVTIYAQKEFYHLFIRQVEEHPELYAIGQPKANERLFQTPNDIIEFYKHNHLLCINKRTTQSVLLKPIIV